jgi:hypothetical protein
MPHYALVIDDGEALGSVELDGHAHAWPKGSIIECAEGSDLRVIGYLEAADPERLSVLVVERTHHERHPAH